MSFTWYPVVTFPLQMNLMPLLSLLRQHHVRHRVTEEQGRQQLWISEPSRVPEVAHLASQWADGKLDIPEARPRSTTRNPPMAAVAGRVLKVFPVNIALIILALLGTLLVYFDTNGLAHASILLFQPVVRGMFMPFSVGMEHGEYWRVVTPIFLHFGWIHLVFNALILWSIGSRIEQAKGSIHYLLLALMVAVSSNIAQYLSQANTAFGGLSGVVYGVVGYMAVYQHFISHPLLNFNKAAIGFFIAWLALGFSGVIDYFIPGSIANAAHLAGLLAGAVIGGCSVWRDSRKS